MNKFSMKNFASHIAISFFYGALFILVFYFFFEEKVSIYLSLINSMAIKESAVMKDVSYNLESKSLINYPKYGTKYAIISIPAIDLTLPVYHGDTKKILKIGVGHYTGSYFPGENGTILYAAHNNPGYFQKLDQLKENDLIKIETIYGTFNYQVQNYKIVKETDLSSFPIQHDEEILIMYTCWPINRSIVGRKKERYVVYAKKIEAINEKV